MELDRSFQLKVLEALKAEYPEILDLQKLDGFDTGAQFMGNLFYLEEHGLIQSVAKRVDVMNAPSMIFTARITAHGLDFLQDDGGLGAILKKVTIRFDDEQIRDLLSQKIESSGLPPEKKSSVLETIRSLSGEALKTVCTRLINLGLDNAPDVYRLIQTGLGQ